VVLPLLVGGIEHRFVAARAGVVDEQIDSAEHALGLGGETRAIACVSDVACKVRDLDAMFVGDCFRAFGEASLVARGEHQAHAFCREALGDGKTDSIAASRDERDFAVESEIHGMVMLGPGGAVKPGRFLRSLSYGVCSAV